MYTYTCMHSSILMLPLHDFTVQLSSCKAKADIMGYFLECSQYALDSLTLNTLVNVVSCTCASIQPCDLVDWLFFFNGERPDGSWRWLILNSPWEDLSLLDILQVCKLPSLVVVVEPFAVNLSWWSSTSKFLWTFAQYMRNNDIENRMMKQPYSWSIPLKYLDSLTISFLVKEG